MAERYPPVDLAATLRLLEDVVEHLPDAVTLSTAVRQDGRTVDLRLDYMNARARAGQPNPDAALGGRLSRLFPSMVENGTLTQCCAVLDEGQPASGSAQWDDEETGEPCGYDFWAIRVHDDTLLWVLHDTTEALRSRAALAESEERHRSVLAALEEGILVEGPDRRVLDANQAAERILGRSLADMPVGGAAAWGVLDEDGRPLEESPSGLVVETGKAQRGRVFGLPVPGGDIRWVSVNTYPVIRPGEDAPSAAVSSLTDVTERRALEAELKHLAVHDPLTELPNRTLLMDRLNQAMRRARRRPGGLSRVALLFCNLDGFRAVNETLGHEAGDEVLREVAMRLLTTAREHDTACRLSGDEFVVLADDIDGPELVLLTQALEDAVTRPVACTHPDGALVDVTVGMSVGVALARSRESARDLLTRADRAMRQVKAARRERDDPA